MYSEHNYFNRVNFSEESLPDIYEYLSHVYDKFIRNKDIARKTYYNWDEIDDLDAEIKHVEEMMKETPKDSKLNQMLKELKRLRMSQTWCNHWYKNDAIEDHKQYIINLAPEWRWDWHPETIFVDVIIVNMYEDRDPEVKQFERMLFCNDWADAHFKRVKSKPIISKLDSLAHRR